MQWSPWGLVLLVPALLLGTATQAGPPRSNIFISFAADQEEYRQGDSALLSWATANAKFCQASGDWSGKMPTEGTYHTEPLDASKSYKLKCLPSASGDRPREETLTITVLTADTVATAPAPTLSFTAAETTVASGGSTTLSWTASDADGCTASGAWSGTRSTSGNESVGPLSADSTFGLSCSGPGGSTSSAVTVSVTDAPPSVSLAAASTVIDSGASTTLSWSADHADSCTASDGWSGSKALTGSESITPTEDTTYTLSCSGDGGSDSASVTVSVNASAPTLSFTAAETTVASGGSTTLSWTASNADGCTASGGWSGTRSTDGNQSVGPISAGTTYSLSCTGPGGSVVEMLSISVVSPIEIQWTAPTENTDGTELSDLAGFRIYYGRVSGSYPEMVEITQPQATTHTLDLESGDHYLTMTAFDTEGNESAHSNEVMETAP